MKEFASFESCGCRYPERGRGGGEGKGGGAEGAGGEGNDAAAYCDSLGWGSPLASRSAKGGVGLVC